MYNFIVVQLSPLQMAAANGGEPAEVERDDVNQAVKDMYEEEGGRAAVIDEITKEMGEGHEGGQKGVLIERLTTIRLLKAKKTNGDDEKTEALLNVDESDDFDEGPAAGAADDRTSWTFNTAKMTLKKVNEMQQTLKKSCLSLRSHELRDALGALGDAGRRHRASDGRHGSLVGLEVPVVFRVLREAIPDNRIHR